MKVAISTFLALLGILWSGTLKTGNIPVPQQIPQVDQPTTYDGRLYYGMVDERVWQYEAEKQGLNILDENSHLKFITQKFPTERTERASKAYDLEQIFVRYGEKIKHEAVTDRISGYGIGINRNLDVIILQGEAYIFRNEGKIDSGKRIVHLGVRVREDDQVYSADVRIPFELFTPNYCSTYFGEKVNSELFLVCAGEKTAIDKATNLILGFAFVKNLTDPTKAELTHIYTGIFEQERKPVGGQYTHLFYNEIGGIIKSPKNEWFIILDKEIVHLGINSEGYLETQEHLKPKYVHDVKRIRSTKSSPDGRYRILTGWGSGAILDTNLAKVIPFSNSCKVETPSDFYNRTIDPANEGAYRSLVVDSWVGNSLRMTQSVANAGCVTEEGKINAVIRDDVVDCEITVTGKLIGC